MPPGPSAVLRLGRVLLPAVLAAALAFGLLQAATSHRATAADVRCYIR